MAKKLNLKKLGFVIVNDISEYLMSYEKKPYGYRMLFTIAPGLAQVFVNYAHAVNVSRRINSSRQLWVLPLFENEQSYFVSSGSLHGDFPPWMATQEDLAK